MPFFQNVFDSEFAAALASADKTFKIRPNSGRSKDVIATWNRKLNYDLSGDDADGNHNYILTISVCNSPDGKVWQDIEIDFDDEEVSLSTITPWEIKTALEANAEVNAKFDIVLLPGKSEAPTLQIKKKAKNNVDFFKFYIQNTGAETVLKFNARAGVIELPTWFSRHSIANRFTYTDGLGLIVELDPDGSDVDAAIIDNAVDANGNSMGFDSSSVSDDYALLKGNSPNFVFRKNTVDGSNRITASIYYNAGSIAGDSAKKVIYTYTAANTTPDKVMEVPYTLESGDLITP